MTPSPTAIAETKPSDVYVTHYLTEGSVEWGMYDRPDFETPRHVWHAYCSGSDGDHRKRSVRNMITVTEDHCLSPGQNDDRPLDWACIGLTVRRRALEAVAMHMAMRGMIEDANECEVLSNELSTFSRCLKP